MKHKNTILALAIVGVFFLSIGGAVQTQASVMPDASIEKNFSLLLMTNAGNRIRESYAFFIKQSVAPLGIDVEILAKPFGQFVGDLLHVSSGQPFDLAIIGFSGGGPTPGFMWKFHSTQTSFGQDMYQLNDPAWQSNMISDLGISTAEVDALLESIDFELDPLTRLTKLNQFAEMFMTKLIYDIPLTTPTGRTAVWKGYGGANNELFDVDEGFVSSSWLGASWTNNPTDRQDDDPNGDTFQTRVAQPGGIGNFDPYQSFDTSTTAQTSYANLGLLTFDKAYAPHPGIAMQWVLEDYMGDNGLVEQGKHTFIINTDFQFPATTDYQGNPVGAEYVDANDFKLALDMLTQGARRDANINGLELYDPVLDYNVSTTYTTDDTLNVWMEDGKITPDDYVTLGGLNAVPAHLLGGTMSLANGTTVNIFNDDGNDQNFQNTQEWLHWATKDGNTAVGPMVINDYEIASGYWDFNARTDFVFPNEWDVMTAYADDNTGFDALWATMNTTGFAGTSLGTFAPHSTSDALGAQAYYYAYADQGGMEKPTTQPLQHVVAKIIPDTNAALLAFESGALDSFGSSVLGANTVAQHAADPRFEVYETFAISGPVLLVMNLLNEHLQKSNVRYSIASVLDKEEMIKINDGFSSPSWSPVWLVYDRFAPPEFIGAGEGGTNLSWYTPFVVPYDFEEARTRMLSEGYAVADDDSVGTVGQEPPTQQVISTIGEVASNIQTQVQSNIQNVTKLETALGDLGSEWFIAIAFIAVSSASFLRKRRHY